MKPLEIVDISFYDLYETVLLLCRTCIYTPLDETCDNDFVISLAYCVLAPLREGLIILLFSIKTRKIICLGYQYQFSWSHETVSLLCRTPSDETCDNDFVISLAYCALAPLREGLIILLFSIKTRKIICLDYQYQFSWSMLFHVHNHLSSNNRFWLDDYILVSDSHEIKLINQNNC